MVRKKSKYIEMSSEGIGYEEIRQDRGKYWKERCSQPDIFIFHTIGGKVKKEGEN